MNLASRWTVCGWPTPWAGRRLRRSSALSGSCGKPGPILRLALHLHDTRGTGLANALMGLQMGIDSFDSSCAGLGGCPFAGHKGAAGNICTEDLVFMCEEMGIETGIDLDALIDCARHGGGHRRPSAARQDHAWRQPEPIPAGSARMTDVLIEKRGVGAMDHHQPRGAAQRDERRGDRCHRGGSDRRPRPIRMCGRWC